jgi:carbon-monoxide dehydrogenase medium subunit
MRRVAGQISYRAVRNHGTIGGSVALADPAADWPVCLIALDATLRFAGRNGVHIEPVADFVKGPYETMLDTTDIIIGFDVPAPRRPLRWGFAKVARKSGAFANSIAIAVLEGDDGPARLVLGAAGPRPRTLPAATIQLRSGSDQQIANAAEADLGMEFPDLDAYQKRMHVANIMHAVQDMRSR